MRSAVCQWLVLAIACAVVRHAHALPLRTKLRPFRAAAAAAAAVSGDGGVTFVDAHERTADDMGVQWVGGDVTAEADDVDADADAAVVVGATTRFAADNAGAGAGAGAGVSVGVGAMNPHNVHIHIAQIGGNAVNVNVQCALQLSDNGAHNWDNALVNPLRTCATLQAALNGWVPPLTFMQSHVATITFTTAGAAGVQSADQWAGHGAVTVPANAASVDITLHNLKRVRVERWTLAGAASTVLHPVLFFNAAQPRTVHQVWADATALVAAEVALLNRLYGDELQYAWAHADAYTAAGNAANGNNANAVAYGAGAAHRVANDHVVRVNQPVLITVLRAVAGTTSPAVYLAFIAQTPAATFDDAFITAVRASPVIANGFAITRANCILSANGVAVAAGGAVNIAHALVLEILPDVVALHGLFPDHIDVPTLAPVPQCELGIPNAIRNAKVDTNTGAGASAHVFYINHQTDTFRADANGERAAAAAALVTASGTTATLMTPEGVYDRLTDLAGGPERVQVNGVWQLGALQGPARTLKRAMGIITGAGNINAHWGCAYFKVTVKVHRAFAAHPHSLTRYVGWLSCADNLAAGPTGGNSGAGVHTEQRIMEQLRAFINALEVPDPTRYGLKLTVTELHSRWVTDFVPDSEPSGANQCYLMFKFMAECAAHGYFRKCVYNENVRNRYVYRNPNQGVAHDYPSQAFMQTYMERVYGDANGVITWNAPAGSFVYFGHQRAGHDAALVPMNTRRTWAYTHQTDLVTAQNPPLHPGHQQEARGVPDAENGAGRPYPAAFFAPLP